MKSSAAVYNRLEIAAKRLDRRPLYAWLMRRTDNAVRDVIAHGLNMANDPDYRLGVEADRFARREYAEAFDGFMGLGRTGDRYRALIEGALRLRAGIDTDTRRESTRREVERLRAEMRAEIDAPRAPAPREYRYGAQNRPPGYGATPRDILRVDPPIPGVPQTRHGVVVYARPLTDKEVYDYELAPYLSVADVVAAALVKLSDYGADYAALIREGETDVFRGVLDEGTPFYTDTDYAGIERAVSAALLAKYPAAPVAPVSTLRASILPRDARKGDRIVDVETRKDGTIEVAFGSYATDDAGRFEWRSARSQDTRVFKTRAGADKAIRAWLDRDAPAPTPVAPTETKTRAKIVNLGVKRFGVEVDGVITGRFVFNRTQSKYGPQIYAAYTDPTTGAEIAIGYTLFDEMKRAMLDKFGALAPTDTRRFPVQGFAASTLDAEADGLRDSPDEDDGDEDDAAIRAVVRAYEAGKRKALVVSRAEVDAVIAGLTVLANTEDERAEAERKRPVSKRDPESARMTRAASDGLSALSTRIFKAFKRSVS